MDTSAFWIESLREPGRMVFRLHGVVDEFADLSALTHGDLPELELDLHDVRRINSFGVRAWIEVMRQIPREVRVRFCKCSPPVVEQCNMVTAFSGHAEIVSFYAPMICEPCDEQLDILVDSESCRARGNTLPRTPCPSCQRDMEIDDLEEQYLLFLREP